MKALLVDDHALLREALADLMQRDWPTLILLQSGSLSDACAQCDAHPDLSLVLIDLGLPDAQGLQSLHTLRERAPHARHVVISADDQHRTVIEAIDAGASGFIPKTTEFRVMMGALSLVLGGGVYLPTSALVRNAVPEAGSDLALTPRQLEVLGLLVAGHPNKQISRQLALSASTVKTHVEAIYRRLSVNSRTQAVVAVARLGLKW